LFLLIIVAFSLRLSGIFWGIPPYDASYYHPDEPKVIEGAYHFPGDIFTRQDLRYPTAFHYLIGLLTWPIRFVSQQTKLDTFQVTYMVGRFLSVAMGTGTILLVYWLAKRRYNEPISLIAATLLAFMMFHVSNSSLAKTDVATSFFLALFLLLLLILLDHKSIWLALVTGAVLGLLVGTKYTGAFVIIPFLILILVNAFQELVSKNSIQKRILPAFSNQYLWIISISALMVFLISTPTILIRPSIFFSSIQFEQDCLEQFRLAFYELNTWKNAFYDLTTAVGFPLAIIASLSLISACSVGKLLKYLWPFC
jgi:hypothetical protein